MPRKFLILECGFTTVILFAFFSVVQGERESHLSSGEVTGIVVGSLLGFLLFLALAIGCYLYVRRLRLRYAWRKEDDTRFQTNNEGVFEAYANFNSLSQRSLPGKSLQVSKSVAVSAPRVFESVLREAALEQIQVQNPSGKGKSSFLDQWLDSAKPMAFVTELRPIDPLPLTECSDLADKLTGNEGEEASCSGAAPDAAPGFVRPVPSLDRARAAADRHCAGTGTFHHRSSSSASSFHGASGNATMIGMGMGSFSVGLALSSSTLSSPVGDVGHHRVSSSPMAAPCDARGGERIPKNSLTGDGDDEEAMRSTNGCNNSNRINGVNGTSSIGAMDVQGRTCVVHRPTTFAHCGSPYALPWPVTMVHRSQGGGGSGGGGGIAYARLPSAGVGGTVTGRPTSRSSLSRQLLSSQRR